MARMKNKRHKVIKNLDWNIDTEESRNDVEKCVIWHDDCNPEEFEKKPYGFLGLITGMLTILSLIYYRLNSFISLNA